MQTNIPIGSPLAVKRWSTALATETKKLMYFTRFIAEGDKNIIQQMTELEGEQGDTIKYDLLMNLRGEMVYGDDNVEGKEENLSFYQDEVKIDQARKPVDLGGRMSRKRTIHHIRDSAKNATSRFTSEWMDELFFVYLSGTLDGRNADAKVTRAFAGNPIQAPDQFHMQYGGAATSQATMTDADVMSRDVIERISVMPRMMATENTDVTRMSPVTVEGGGKHYVMLMNPWQAHSLRIEKAELSWADIQKAAATAEGNKNPLFRGGLGMINDVVLHQHENVRYFSNYGAGQNVGAARALFMGAQAGVVAYGEPSKGSRFSWVEKKHDADNRVAIYAGTIAGVKKTRFNGLDYGVVAVDTAARSPNRAA